MLDDNLKEAKDGENSLRPVIMELQATILLKLERIADRAGINIRDFLKSYD